MTTTRPLPTSYGMFSATGNTLVRRMVEAAIALPSSTTDKAMHAFLSKRVKAIAKASDRKGGDCAEVWDTAVREHFVSVIERRTGRSLSIYEI